MTHFSQSIVDNFKQFNRDVIASVDTYNTNSASKDYKATNDPVVANIIAGIGATATGISTFVENDVQFKAALMNIARFAGTASAGIQAQDGTSFENGLQGMSNSAIDAKNKMPSDSPAGLGQVFDDITAVVAAIMTQTPVRQTLAPINLNPDDKGKQPVKPPPVNPPKPPPVKPPPTPPKDDGKRNLYIGLGVGGGLLLLIIIVLLARR